MEAREPIHTEVHPSDFLRRTILKVSLRDRSASAGRKGSELDNHSCPGRGWRRSGLVNVVTHHSSACVKRLVPRVTDDDVVIALWQEGGTQACGSTGIEGDLPE